MFRNATGYPRSVCGWPESSRKGLSPKQKGQTAERGPKRQAEQRSARHAISRPSCDAFARMRMRQGGLMILLNRDLETMGGIREAQERSPDPESSRTFRPAHWTRHTAKTVPTQVRSLPSLLAQVTSHRTRGQSFARLPALSCQWPSSHRPTDRLRGWACIARGLLAAILAGSVLANLPRQTSHAMLILFIPSANPFHAQ